MLFTSTQSASPQDWVLNCIYVYLFIHSFTYSYFFYYYLFVSLNLIILTKYDISVLKSFKKHAHLLPLKVRHRNLELELIYLNVYLDSCLFLDLIWFLLNTGMTFLFWNHSIIGQHYLLPLKVPHRKIEFWIVFMFIYLFIHSLIRIFFYYYLFVSLNLIYINQVWHFCFEIVQKYTPIYFHSKCVTAT